jgi:hypothetical protein
MQQPAAAVTTRNRAILGIRAGTVAAVIGALGLTWMFGVLAEGFFSGKPTPALPVPPVPQQAAPVQRPPKVVQVIVHHSGNPPTSTGTQPRPPASNPGTAPAPAPPPACHSTPTKPC